MKRIIWLLLSLLLISSCTPSEEIIRNAIAATELAEIKSTSVILTVTPELTITPTLTEEPYYFLLENELLNILYRMVNYDWYDPDIHVAWKYLDYLEVSISDDEISFISTKEPENLFDALGLAGELFTAAIVFTEAGEEGDWGISRYELKLPTSTGNTLTYFIEGRENIIGFRNKVRNKEIDLFDIIELESS